MFKRVDNIIANHLCYGCGTCDSVCNAQAITMIFDEIGRLLPQIDETLCTNCGLCAKMCPSVDIKNIQLPKTEDVYIGDVISTFIGKSNDKKIFENAQSGGLVTAVLKKLFETCEIDAAICCKVDFANEYTSSAVVITSVSGLYDCQKSSYVPVDICSAIKQTENYKSIAVVGTGCHIQGFNALKKYKQKFNDRIKYSFGLICDRTLCKTVTDVLYSDYFENEDKKIVWRDKSSNYKNARLIITTADGKMRKLPSWQRFVLKDPFTNPRCRICFDKLNVNADVVFGDPWGMFNVDWENGESVIITRTQKGDRLILKMMSEGDIMCKNAMLSEVIAGQFIEKRKRQVSSALKYYKKIGWQIPSYAGKLILDGNEISADKNISDFIADSKLKKKEIVKKYRLFLRKKRTIIFFNTIVSNCIKPFKK